MPEVEIKDKNNNPAGKMDLPEEMFAVTAKEGAIHNAVVNFLANQRQGTHATKTKGLVSGGGKKPWKQKHTGRARSGSNRSPLWRGGGIVFGPQPRDYSYALPKKARQLALKATLSMKLSDGEMTILDSLNLDQPKTKDMVSLLKGLGLQGTSTLIVVPEYDAAVFLAARNIPGVSVKRASDLNAYDVSRHKRVLLTRSAAETLAEAGKK
jgi:large subunit ribosomal protein L4